MALLKTNAVAWGTIALLLPFLAATPGLADENPSPFRFTEATAGSGIGFRNLCGAPTELKGLLLETFAAGAAWLDYDGDGKLDLYLVNGSAPGRGPGEGEPNRLYRGEGKGGFIDVTARAGVGDRGWGYGVAVGDIENDGDPDLFVTNLGTNVLYRNKGDGTFEEITKQAGLAESSEWSTATTFFDMDKDGNLDLYVGNNLDGKLERIPRRGTEEAARRNCTYRNLPVYCGPLGLDPEQDRLFRNKGDGTFEDVTRAAGMIGEKSFFTLGVVAADFDNDGDQDLYIANDSVQNSLWRNNGDGTFVDVGVQMLVALNADGRAQAGMGTHAGDYDGDGWLDIIVTNFAHDLNTLYRNMGGKFFIDDSMLAGMGVTNLALSWGTGFYDFDYDGDLDLFVANGHVYPQVDNYDLGTRFHQANHLFVNEGGRFREVSKSSGSGLTPKRAFRGAAFADYDDDGDVDILVTALDDRVLLLRNDAPKLGHHLQLRLVGRRSNRDAVGARVTVVAGGRRQIGERMGGGSYLSHSDPRLHFGLGAAAKAERVEIVWPSGVKDVLRDVPADRPLTVEEGSRPAAE